MASHGWHQGCPRLVIPLSYHLWIETREIFFTVLGAVNAKKSFAIKGRSTFSLSRYQIFSVSVCVVGIWNQFPSLLYTNKRVPPWWWCTEPLVEDESPVVEDESRVVVEDESPELPVTSYVPFPPVLVACTVGSPVEECHWWRLWPL